MIRISPRLAAFVLALMPLAAAAGPVSPPDSIGVVVRQNKVFVRHRVAPGETLYGISRRYHVTVEQLIEANPSVKASLGAGQEILIPRQRAVQTATAAKPAPKPAPKPAVPAGKPTVPTPAAAARPAAPAPAPTAAKPTAPAPAPPATEPDSGDELTTDAQGNKVYRVQPGQTLYSISRRFNTTSADLQRINRMSDGAVQSGQTLIIVPAGASAAEPTAARNSSPARPDRDSAEKPREKADERPVTTPTVATKEEEDEPTHASEVVRKVTESGVASVIEGGNSEKYLALHKTAPVGTIMMVRNIMNGQMVYVRVIGKLPETGENNNVLIRLSRKAVAKLNTPDQRFRVETSYLPE